MDASNLYGLVELVLVFGLVLGFGIWQLVSVRREIRRDREKAQQAEAARQDQP
jgi:cytoskeletal protein RodZ